MLRDPIGVLGLGNAVMEQAHTSVKNPSARPVTTEPRGSRIHFANEQNTS